MIVSFVTRWGYAYGGLNGFNTELCSALAPLLMDEQIVCVVLAATTSEISDASTKGIQLLSLDRSDAEDFDVDWSDKIFSKLEKAFSGKKVSWWIGHNAKTGPICLEMKSRHGGRSALVMHMSYADYESVKRLESNTAKQKIDLQNEIFRAADVCFSNGPLLRDRLNDIITPKPGHMLVPGLFEIDSHPVISRLSALAFGRLDEKHEIIKQGRLTIEAFASAVRFAQDNPTLQDTFWDNPELKLIGVNDPDGTCGEELRELAEETAGGIINLRLLPYTTDRTSVLNEVKTSNQVLLLSWHEGFGLTGWEAVSCGIPLIVNKKAGLYRLLSESLGGAAEGCVTPVTIRASFGGKNSKKYTQQDVDTVRDAILAVGSFRVKKMADAQRLRNMLRQEGFTWSRTARSFATKLCVKVKEPAPSPSIDAAAVEFRPLLADADFEAANKYLSIAQEFYDLGRYKQAVEELDNVNMNSISEQKRLEIYLLRAELCLRLNQYEHCSAYVDKCVQLAQDGYPSLVIRAEGVRNTLMRDNGRYDDAVRHAKAVLKQAQNFGDELLIGRAERRLARSLALVGLCEEAVKHATNALSIAQTHEKGRDQGNAYLALGEAYRHGYQQNKAIENYLLAVKIAAKSANWDSFLWSSICLADSYLLDGKYSESRKTLGYLDHLLHKEEEKFALEELHWRFSICTLDVIEGEKSKTQLDRVIQEYQQFDIKWPREYIIEIEVNRKPVNAKRF